MLQLKFLGINENKLAIASARIFYRIFRPVNISRTSNMAE